MATDEVNVWRKFWYKQIKINGVASQGVSNAPDCYEDVKVIMKAAPDKTIPLVEAKALNPSAIYPKHMINYYYDDSTNSYVNNYPNDTSDGVIVCDTAVHENKFFPAPVNTKERPVTIAMINADGQWDAMGNDYIGNLPWVETQFPIEAESAKELLTPPPTRW